MRLLLITLFLTISVRSEVILGKIGDIELTAAETKEAIAGLQTAQDIAKDPAAVGQYVRALLIQRLVLKQAHDKNFDQDPAVIARLVRARETALSEAYLESHSTPPKEYPNQEELDAAYQSAKPSLLLPRAWRLAQIFTKDEAKLASLKKQLATKGADFAAIAKQNSEETTSAANGGEIGWLQENQIQPAILAKLPSLKTGAITEPLKLDDGWHILKVIDTREPATATLEQVRPQLITRLRADRAKELRSQFIAQLIKDHPLAINEIELSKILSSP